MINVTKSIQMKHDTSRAARPNTIYNTIQLTKKQERLQMRILPEDYLQSIAQWASQIADRIRSILD